VILRTFVAGDIPAVSRLHGRVFAAPPATPPSWAAYDAYFRDVFLAGPDGDTPCQSIVAEERGEVVGFLGVLPLPLRAGKRHIRAAVCTQFAVEPRFRGLTGLKLLRHHLAGPQDLSLTDEANHATRKAWTWAGGETILASSLHWTRPLRPAGLALSLAEQRRGLAFASRLARPAGLVLDAVLSRVPRAFVPAPPAGLDAGPLDAATMAAESAALAANAALRPDYEPRTLSWRLSRAASATHRGPLRAVRLTEQGQTVGWYIYHAPPHRTGDVLQVMARAGRTGEVLAHLCVDAWRAGLVGLSGRVDARDLQAYSDAHCYFTRRGPWTLVHSRRPELVDAFHRGQVCLSRLDGEWCARFS
jgi:hypothetical protein